MANYARIINNVAVDVSPDPENHFHPDIAAEFVPVPDAVIQGSTRDADGAWVPPVQSIQVAPEAIPPKVSPVEFKLLFTAQERIAIKAARASDPVIEDAFEILEDPRLKEVDLGLSSNQALIEYLVTKGLVTEDRKVNILAGIIQ